MPIPFISEQDIDTAAKGLNEAASNFETAIAEMQVLQPVLFAYLLSENFNFLTKEEREYLLYLALVIWKAIHSKKLGNQILTPEFIEEVEEKNWTLLDEIKTQKFSAQLDVFFDNYPQEDLLAFVEDALADDEDSFVTKEGRMCLFIGLKTVIDCLTGGDNDKKKD